MFIFINKTPKHKQYCSNNKITSKCIRCPSNARCYKTNITCKENFVLTKNKQCIQDNEDYSSIGILVDYAIDLLRKRAGDFQCGYCNIDYYTVDHLDSILFGENLVETNEYPELFGKVMRYLERENYTSMNPNDNKVILFSKEAERSFNCLLKNLSFRIFVVYVALVIIWVVIRRLVKLIKKNARNNRMATFQAGIVLKEMQKCSTEIESVALRKRFENDKNNGIDISLWPLIEKKLKKSNSIIYKRRNGRDFYCFIPK